MRHLGSLLLSLLLTAVWYVALGIGLSRFFTHGDGVPSTGSKLFLALMIVVCGVLYSLLVLLRLSPVGPVLVGLVVLGLGLWELLVTGKSAAFEVLPRDLFGQKLALELPVSTGIATFAAVPLILTVFSPRRWRRYANPVAGPSAYSATPPVPVPLAPAGGYPPPAGFGSPVADPFASPVSPAGTAPDPTRAYPGSDSAGYGSSSSSPSYGSPSYGSSGYGSTPSYQPPSPAAPAYPPPTTYPATSYPPPSSGAPSYPTPASPVWPSTPDDGESTRPL